MRLLFSILLFCTSTSTFAYKLPQFDELSFGIGLGAQYSGLGINISANTETDSKYLSFGCIGFSAYEPERFCGATVGWINTNWISQQTNKHGLGVHLGIVGREQLVTTNVAYSSYYQSDIITSYTTDFKSLYGIGLGYSYFSNGVNKSGATYGISIHTPLKEEYLGEALILLQVGYQF